MQVVFEGNTLRFVATEQGDQYILRILEARANLPFLVSSIEKQRDVDTTRDWTIEVVEMHPIPQKSSKK